MNLEEFFNLRKNCPFCGKELINKLWSPHRNIPIPFWERAKIQLDLAAKGFFFPADKTKIQVESWVRLEGFKFFSDLAKDEVELDLKTFNDCTWAEASCESGKWGEPDYHSYRLDSMRDIYWGSTHEDYLPDEEHFVNKDFIIEIHKTEALLEIDQQDGIEIYDHIPGNFMLQFNDPKLLHEHMKNSRTYKLEKERRFLVKLPLSKEAETIISAAPQIKITQTYLKNEDGLVERVRHSYTRVLQAVFDNYTHTIKQHWYPGCSREEEKEVSLEEYCKLLLNADYDRRPMAKTRVLLPSFLPKEFELDLFHGQNEGLAILEIELGEASDLNEMIILPEFLEVIREITGEEEYSNYNLAKKKSIT